MARITHVKKAQQRFETVPVIDPETGEPKRTPVMRDGEQKTTKRGKAVFMTVTAQDRTKPIEPYTCDSCRKTIEVGTPYKHISPKSGPYGGRKLTRHESCPTWQVWEYSSSMSARLAQISYEFGIHDFETPDDVQAALDAAAESVRELAEEKRESASNIEDGFGHPTSMSEELEQVADDLDQWADDIEAADIPELPEPEEGDCEDCEGTGWEGGKNEHDTVPCDTCNGTGLVTPEEPTEDQMGEWRDDVADATSIVDESPV